MCKFGIVEIFETDLAENIINLNDIKKKCFNYKVTTTDNTKFIVLPLLYQKAKDKF